MKKIHAVSRVLAVLAVAFVGNSFATCPLFQNKVVDILHQNKGLIGASLAADYMCDKNEHAKKAFMCSVVPLTTKNSHTLAERFVIDYMIRKGSDAIGLDQHAAAILKKCDVLPEGVIRDNVNPVVKGIVDIAIHPETITEVVMVHVIPQIIGAVKPSGN